MPAATASVLIVVVDVNDNLPQFGAASYVAEVDENQAPSEPIAIVWVKIPSGYIIVDNLGGSWIMISHRPGCRGGC